MPARNLARLSPALRASLLITAMRMAGIGLQALTLILLTHVLPPAPLGIYATVYASTAIVRLLGPAGFDQLALRGMLTGGDAAGPWDAAAWVLALNLPLAAALATLAWALGAPVSPADIALTAALLPAFALAGLLAGYVRGTGGVIAAQWPESVLLPLLIALGLALGHAAGGLTLTRALVGLFAAAWITTAVYAVLARRRGGGAGRRPSIARARPMAREGGAIFVALLFTALSARAPMLLALPLLGPVGAALMEVANRFGTLGSVVTSSVATSYSPVFARGAAAGDRPALWRALRGGALFSGAAGVAIAVLLAALFPLAVGTVLPALYGASYSALAILAAATAVNAGLGLASNLMFMRGEASRVRAASLVQAIAIYGASVPLGLRFGAAGIAGACLAGAMLRDGWLFWRVSRELR